MYIRTVLCLLLFSTSSYAQMASSSIFREMRAENPAVISLRPAAVVSLAASMDKIKKEKNIESMYGAGAKSTEDISVTGGELYWGGKGPGLTTELLGEVASGQKKSKLESSTENVDTSNNVSTNYINLGLGIGQNFGVSLRYLTYDYAEKFDGSFGGDAVSFDSKSEAEIKAVRLGYRTGKAMSFGIYYEHLIADMDYVMDGESGNSSTTYMTAGVGIGHASKNLHYELFYERRLKSEDQMGKTYNPDKIGATFEVKFGTLSLGYTGSYYRDGFFNLEGILYNNMAYANAAETPRFEHAFNFSLGSDKGHSISGSAYYSKVESEEDIGWLITDQKYPTTITSMGLSAKYTYSF